MNRLEQTLKAIDDYNRKDPSGRELPYSERLTGWVLKLNPSPSDVLRIAARGQHVGRWTSPRQSYPMDRGGYLRWREDLKKFHARTVSDLMKAAGYADADQDAARQIILKKNLPAGRQVSSANADAQTVEDALCLVFLETQFEELRQKTPDEKMIDIIRKTWRKMSEQAKRLALQMELPAVHKDLILKALN